LGCLGPCWLKLAAAAAAAACPAGPNDGKAAVKVEGLVKEAVLLDMVLHKSQFMGNDMAGCMKW
jgi:hypothetical protein